MWIDVTWGAGGSTADTTLSLCETAMDVTGLDVLMHLTCTNVTIDTTRQVLQRCKEKVDAGADFGVTQLFYDTNLYFEFLKKSHAIGVPKSFDVFPGLMPIQSYAGFRRMTGLCKTFIPKPIDEALELVKDNEAAVKEYGIELAVQMCRELMAGGCPGLHLYTLNLEKSATAICEKLGLVDDSAVKEYPFNRSTGTRGVESTRPIFWAQRTKSYVERTQGWNEFPDGRFGQRDETAFKSASPAK